MSDPEKEFSRELLTLKDEMYGYVREIHDGLNKVIDEDYDTDMVLDPLREGYEIYQQMNDVSARSLVYGEIKSDREDPHHYTQTKDELKLDERQVVDFASMIEAQRDYEEALLRFIGINEEMPIIERTLQDVLDEEDVTLPEALDANDFRQAEILG